MITDYRERIGKVQTVTGLIDSDALGVVLPHEHIFVAISGQFKEPSEASEKELAHQPINLENLDWVRRHLESNLDNLSAPEEVLIKEIMFYKMAGGDTIVDLTCSKHMGRDPRGLIRLSRATRINIIMSTGIYEVYSGFEDTRIEEELTEEMVREITVGIGDTGVRAGIIGEIGHTWPLTDVMRKILRASAHAQKRTGAAINIHPPLKAPSRKEQENSILEITQVLDDAGADLSRTVISHVDSGCLDTTFCRRLADKGCYLEWDTFGWEGYPPRDQQSPDLPNDAQRINQIIQLIADGCLKHILVSGDHGMKVMFRTYGGWGYDHILTNVVPLMRYKGISDEQIRTLLVENPKRILPFAPVKA